MRSKFYFNKKVMFYDFFLILVNRTVSTWSGSFAVYHYWINFSRRTLCLLNRRRRQTMFRMLRIRLLQHVSTRHHMLPCLCEKSMSRTKRRLEPKSAKLEPKPSPLNPSRASSLHFATPSGVKCEPFEHNVAVLSWGSPKQFSGFQQRSLAEA